MDAAVETQLDEAMKKTGLVWVRATGRGHRAIGMWHLWQDGEVYLLTGGIEQPAPDGLEPGATAHVTARAKGKNARVLSFEVAVESVAPDTEEWQQTTAALVPKRLNLPDGETAPQRWARECTLWRLRPTGVIVETAQDPTTTSHAAAPPPSPARTRVPRPLHLRGRPAKNRGGR
jgi:hypothetical protein